jgi:histidine ammonia-lyase
MSDAAPLSIDGASLTLERVAEVARGGRRVSLDAGARARMERSWRWVQEAGRGERAIYGVNTGFGSLARVRIPPERGAELSRNLVRSHAAGTGAPLPKDVVRATLLLRANALAKGVSGCRPVLVETLLQMLDAGVVPVVPSQGSCGSSGDLAPLAHVGLVMSRASRARPGSGASTWRRPTPWRARASRVSGSRRRRDSRSPTARR